MSKYSKMSLRKGKTDRLDATKIASYGLNYWNQLVDFSFAPTVYDEMRILNRQYLSYLSIRLKAKQALSNLLDKIMPGIKSVLWNRSDVPDRDKLSDFLAYAGVDSPPFQSGNFNATNRSISKRGSSSLRKTGVEIMRWVK